MRLSTERDGRARAQGDEGAALVEFALVMVLLFMLIFGIISFGLILSFKQDMTRAAAEGARAGAVAFPATDAEPNALAAMDDQISQFGGPNWSSTGCESNPRPGMTCSVVVDACDGSHDPLATQCVFVEMSFDYQDHPLFGEIPLISAFMPEEINAKAVARTNP